MIWDCKGLQSRLHLNKGNSKYLDRNKQIYLVRVRREPSPGKKQQSTKEVPAPTKTQISHETRYSLVGLDEVPLQIIFLQYENVDK